MKLYDRFAETKEEGFREDFIKPFLLRMGFVNISNKHGSLEFGKDYVFSEYDRFSTLRHMVVQAKHEQSISQGSKVDTLLSQVRQAFNVPYHLPFALREERYVSAVYVFNTGAITENAQTQIRTGLDPALRSNVYFFDGDHLDLLNNAIAQRYGEHVRIRLAALITQLAINVHIFDSIKAGIDLTVETQTFDVRGPIMHGLETFLTEPFCTDHIQVGVVTRLWEQCSILKSLLLKCYAVPLRTTNRPDDLALLISKTNDAIATATELIQHASTALERLPAALI